MTDLFDQLPSPPNLPTTAASGGGRRAARLSANGKPLGRPPGARNRGSVQLAKYIEATFGGMTPGQQSAELCLVKPRDLAQAKAAARELGMVDVDLPPITLAMAVKAKRLARAIGCTTMEAWVLLAKERMELMAYVHQKQPAAEVKDAKQLPTMFVVERGDLEQAQLAAPGADAEILEDFDLPGEQVSPPKSHGGS